MSDCRFGVSPVNYPDPDPDLYLLVPRAHCICKDRRRMNAYNVMCSRVSLSKNVSRLEMTV